MEFRLQADRVLADEHWAYRASVEAVRVGGTVAGLAGPLLPEHGHQAPVPERASRGGELGARRRRNATPLEPTWEPISKITPSWLPNSSHTGPQHKAGPVLISQYRA
ncbi:hypothetical protein GCM10017668_38290 [Streptomyces tuirus]|uniref:Uncharacterized protein n=1 Tax=Streptomyces tuirus TaxID=68278 RepID=A0A7G1NK71_9ACTN|nr:hypothetical protein GCM10017668_38290 [Streptomyces tuirus]